MVTREIKLFQNYFSLRPRPPEIVLPKIILQLFRGLLQLVNIFQHVECRRNNFEIISAAEIILK